MIIVDFPWVNVTPTLHKLLANCAELIRDCNNGRGLKEFSEEGLEACNKLIRRIREHLARKTCFSHNTKDVFIRLLTQSDPVLQSFRKHLKCGDCGEYGHTNRVRCQKINKQDSSQDRLVNSLLCNT